MTVAREIITTVMNDEHDHENECDEEDDDNVSGSGAPAMMVRLMCAAVYIYM